MKAFKYVSLILVAVFLFSSMQFATLAASDAKEPIRKSANEVEIIFNNDISPYTQSVISAHVHGQDTVPASENAKGITCTLLGHNLDTGTYSTITHKARTTAPRCLKEVFNYEVCTRCDYSKYTRISYSYIYCC